MEKEQIAKLRSRIDEVARTTKEKSKEVKYVDIDGNLKKLKSLSNFVIYGRRGSGKTTLLLKSFDSLDRDVLQIFIQCETYKEHTYPNLLINILMQIFKQIKKSFNPLEKIKHYKLLCKVNYFIKKLSGLMNEPDECELFVEDSKKIEGGLGMSSTFTKPIGLNANLNANSEHNSKYTQKQKKIEYLNNQLDDFKELLQLICEKLGYSSIFLYFDDFYHLNFIDQPFIADYILRLCKDLKIYFKIATIRHRTNLYVRDSERRIRGIQEGAEHATINLDFSLENFSRTKGFLTSILTNLCSECKCGYFLSLFVKTDNGIDRVVWASGGVPRDFLLIIGEIIDNIDWNEKIENIKIDKKIIDEAAQKIFKDKLQDLNSEYALKENVLAFYGEVYDFCVKYNKKSGFIIQDPNEDEAISEKVKDLLDHRLVHQVIRNMTLKRYPGSFAGYILDIGSYSHVLNLRKDEYKIKEIDILRQDQFNKDTLIEFRSLSTANELTRDNLDSGKQFIVQENERLSKIKVDKKTGNKEYKNFFQSSIFDILK